MRRENPERFSPGVPELSLILGSRPYGGVSGDGVLYSQPKNGSNHLCRGMGCHMVRLMTRTLEPAHCHSHCALGPAHLYFGIRVPVGVWGFVPAARMSYNAALGSRPLPSAYRATPLPCSLARSGAGSAVGNRTLCRPRAFWRVPTGSIRHPTSAHRARFLSVSKGISRRPVPPYSDFPGRARP